MQEIVMYTLKEVEGMLKVTRRTLYNYLKAGEIEATKVGREWRVSREALQQFLLKRTNQRNDQQQ